MASLTYLLGGTNEELPVVLYHLKNLSLHCVLIEFQFVIASVSWNLKLGLVDPVFTHCQTSAFAPLKWLVEPGTAESMSPACVPC